MEKKIEGFIFKIKKKNRKRFDLDTLEDYIIDSYKGYNSYSRNGGYFKFYEAINLLKEKEYIKEIKSSPYNGLSPGLKIRWEIISKEETNRWDKTKILQFSDLLNFSYYISNPKYQTDLEWEYIENIYNFLKYRNSRQYSSVEERSLELFYNEKFLTGRKETAKGKYGILSRLKLSYEDLKMKRYGEMFVYWNRGIKEIKNIIILENHSTFFTYKRIAEDGSNIFGFLPDIIIYGGGKKIEKSFSFLEELADISKVEVLYFGDIDSEGFGIYSRLKKRYPKVRIKLQYEAYKHLMSISDRHYPLGEQKKKEIYLETFLEEIKSFLDDTSLIKIKQIWDGNFRIPQELINYEYLQKVKK